MTVEPGRKTDSREPPESPTDPERWLDEHGDALYRYALAQGVRRDAAEDLVQECFLAALRARERFDGDSSERTWLLAILRHKLVDHYRRGAAARVESGWDPEEDGPRGDILNRFFRDDGTWRRAPSAWKITSDPIENREFLDLLDACLERLPGPLAAAFLLREVEGLDMDAVRQRLAIASGNLRIRLHRARLLLRDCLGKHGFGEPADDPRRTT
ncbi:MAG: sigma-70 family RNA polymerase sigma factor [Paludisphaera borealis]|uniref:sigma-70 family RNA polymerase sigma factor n=1 Tax=Paludisphaera borealis TaxID=1387353 RepID=UPI002843419E|nr:sigma-70 family RNA polymerase sigma factor [Paludisphaera borealis]MDR3618490.1 sigma-70 family RNA polymerase sigma factor [Paludisphaera borealis]